MPDAIADWVWTVQGQVPSGDLTVSIVEMSTGQALPATAVPLSGNYGNSPAIRIDRTGWSARANETYTVELSGTRGAAVRYSLTPTACP